MATDYGLQATAFQVSSDQEMSSFTLEGSPPDDWVVVKSVTQGMWAESQGLQEGDILLTIGEKKVESMSEQEMKDLLSMYLPAILTFGYAPVDSQTFEPSQVEAIDGMDTFVLLAERIEDHQTFELSGMPPADWVTISAVHEG